MYISVVMQSQHGMYLYNDAHLTVITATQSLHIFFTYYILLFLHVKLTF